MAREHTKGLRLCRAFSFVAMVALGAIMAIGYSACATTSAYIEGSTETSYAGVDILPTGRPLYVYMPLDKASKRDAVELIAGLVPYVKASTIKALVKRSTSLCCAIGAGARSEGSMAIVVKGDYPRSLMGLALPRRLYKRERRGYTDGERHFRALVYKAKGSSGNSLAMEIAIVDKHTMLIANKVDGLIVNYYIGKDNSAAFAPLYEDWALGLSSTLVRLYIAEPSAYLSTILGGVVNFALSSADGYIYKDNTEDKGYMLDFRLSIKATPLGVRNRATLKALEAMLRLALASRGAKVAILGEDSVAVRSLYIDEAIVKRLLGEHSANTR